MEFVPQVITPTIAGAPVSVVITTSRTLAEGSYTLPILAIGAGTTHTLEMPAMILAPDFGIEPRPTSALLRRGHSGRPNLHPCPARDDRTDPSQPGGRAAGSRPPLRPAGHRAWRVQQPGHQRDSAIAAWRLHAQIRASHHSASAPPRCRSLSRSRATYLPLLIRSAPPPCVDVVINGGFEANAAWTFPITADTAGYTTAQAFSGARSARFGLLPGMAAAAAQGDGPARIETNLLGEAGVLGRPTPAAIKPSRSLPMQLQPACTSGTSPARKGRAALTFSECCCCGRTTTACSSSYCAPGSTAQPGVRLRSIWRPTGARAW